ncbi:hypothetical protein H0H93_006299 [Arthromyces matolae]|nr:hypothetical protein H0H93_006299 [Arthromyces matolae]
MTTCSPIRSPDFWFHDGSIVLSAEGTLFRVHQTILANHSQIFSDIFSLPQPSGSKDDNKIEGCQVIDLQDKCKDVLDLLKAIYHPAHFDQLSPTSDLDNLLNFIGGILRLSTKYVIPELRKRCVALLSARFPASYEHYMALGPRPYVPSTSASTANESAIQDDDSLNWSSIATFSLVSQANSPNGANGSNTTAFLIHPDQQVASTNGHLHPNHHQPTRSRRHSDNIHTRSQEYYRFRAMKDSLQPPKAKPSSIMRAIALASETNVMTILPYAYYLLARTSEPHRLLSHSSSSAAFTWHQKAITLVGRSYLHAAEISSSHSFLVSFTPAASCLSPSTCQSSRGPLAEWALLCTKGRGGPEPLRPWDRWERLGVCQACVKNARKRHESGREGVWQRLPSYFELGTWSRLRDLQEL